MALPMLIRAEMVSGAGRRSSRCAVALPAAQHTRTPPHRRCPRRHAVSLSLCVVVPQTLASLAVVSRPPISVITRVATFQGPRRWSLCPPPRPRGSSGSCDASHWPTHGQPSTAAGWTLLRRNTTTISQFPHQTPRRPPSEPSPTIRPPDAPISRVACDARLPRLAAAALAAAIACRAGSHPAQPIDPERA